MTTHNTPFSMQHQIDRAVTACEIDTDDMTCINDQLKRELYQAVCRIEYSINRYRDAAEIHHTLLDLFAGMHDDDYIEYLEHLADGKTERAHQMTADLFFATYATEIQKALDTNLRQLNVERAMNTIAGYRQNPRPALRDIA